MRTTYPDPLITANIYASGLLDDVLRRVMVPSWHDMQQISGESYMWLVRYSRGGQHLKVRVHAAPAFADELKQALTHHTDVYFKSLHDQSPAAPRISKSSLPPIDLEDKAETEFPDRTMVWTTYQRSHVTFGMKPWFMDDSFTALACDCLARGCDLMLGALAAGSLDSLADRQKLLLHALLPALAGLRLSSDSAAASYLRYHRDWLLRFFVAETAREQQLLRHFEEKAASMSAALEEFHNIGEQMLSHTPAGPWPVALGEFASYISGFQGRKEYDLDPFTDDVTFPPTFKILHGLANQVGMPPLQEAFVHHLLLASVELPPISISAEAGNVRRAI
ncbi:MAG TPA: lantibiotic dehydratase C-terminal domain-containing protein [Candidatus Angelobacter sp.]|jgi:hypothetical protein